jgi:hypothetical protein
MDVTNPSPDILLDLIIQIIIFGKNGATPSFALFCGFLRFHPSKIQILF